VDFVDLGRENEYLALKILVFETWIGFELPVKSISLKEVDVLRAQVIDGQEKIEALKNKLAVQFISVRANANTSNGQIIAWPVDVHNSSNEVFAKNDNHQKIIVKVPGVYQIHVRIGLTNTENGYATYLRLNDNDVAYAFCSDAHGHKKTVQITEILVLNANDNLSVRCKTNSQTILSVQNTVLSVVKFT
jgi:hypothetical protein